MSSNIPQLRKNYVENAESNEDFIKNYDQNVAASKEIINQALCQYERNQLCLCFDGGKDGHLVLQEVVFFTFTYSLTYISKSNDS